MKRPTMVTIASLLAITSIAFYGCAENEDVAEQNAPTAAESAGADLPPEVAAELANLPEEDRQLALEQRICPVSEKLLGSMGQPVKLSVDGQEVFICCAACEDPLRSESEEHLQKLNE